VRRELRESHPWEKSARASIYVCFVKITCIACSVQTCSMHRYPSAAMSIAANRFSPEPMRIGRGRAVVSNPPRRYRAVAYVGGNDWHTRFRNSLGITLRNTNRAESYCCCRALCRMASDIHQRRHPQSINSETPLHVLSPKKLWLFNSNQLAKLWRRF